MPIKEGIEYGVNKALTNLRSKPISITPDLPLATRINLLKDKDPKRYQENIQRLIQAEKDGNEEARKLLGEIGEDAGRSRRGYEKLATAMTVAPIAAVAAPYVSAIINNPITQSIFTINGVKNAFTENGVNKTYDLFKNKEYLKGIKSGIGDILDIGIPGYQGYKAIKFGKEIYNTLGNLKDAIKIGSMEMPVANLFQNKSYKIGKELWNMPTKKIHNIPIYHATDYLGNNFEVSSGRGEVGLHVGLDKDPSNFIVNNYLKNPNSQFRNFEDTPIIREGIYTYWGDIIDTPDYNRFKIDKIYSETPDLIRSRINDKNDVEIINQSLKDIDDYSIKLDDYKHLRGLNNNSKQNPSHVRSGSSFVE